MATKEVKRSGTLETQRIGLGAGETLTVKTLDTLSGSVSVWPTSPGAGLVETTTSHTDYIDLAIAKWSEWPIGSTAVDVSAYPFKSRITAIRVSASGGDVTFELILNKEV